MTITLISHFFSFLMVIIIVFQLALVAGKPWGELTLGGKYPGVIPKNRRWIPFLSVSLLIHFALIVETRAGTMLPEWYPISEIAIWIVVGYCGLGILANSITPSKWERIIWLPVVLLAFFSSLIVAMS